MITAREQWKEVSSMPHVEVSIDWWAAWIEPNPERKGGHNMVEISLCTRRECDSLRLSYLMLLEEYEELKAKYEALKKQAETSAASE